MSCGDDSPDRRLAALAHQNRLLLVQVEALRAALAERDDEITRLSARLLEAQTERPAPRPGLLARLWPGRR